MAKGYKADIKKDLTPDEYWYIYLTEGLRGVNKHFPFHRRILANLEPLFFRLVPTDPRCVSCRAPFRGLGVPVMRAIGRQQSTLNPSICAVCENYALKYKTKAELDLAILFADVRGSTKLAERMKPAEFSQLINRFFNASTNELVLSGAMVEKLIGDEVTAFFVPGLAGKHYHRRAVEAAKRVLKATGHNEASGPWIPVGIGVHSGESFVGAVGKEGGLSQISVLGDTANVASRLAAAARVGEILLSEEIVQKAGLETTGLEKRELSLKGKSGSVIAWVLHPVKSPKISSQNRSGQRE